MRDTDILAVLTKPMRAKYIAEALGVPGSSLGFYLGSMERRGLIKGTGSKSHKRWEKI